MKEDRLDVCYYEFTKNAPYYALIMATNTFEALKQYETEVSDIEYYDDVLPDELSEKTALEIISNSRYITDSDFENETGMRTAGKIVQEGKKHLSGLLVSLEDEKRQPIATTLLIDGGLV